MKKRGTTLKSDLLIKELIDIWNKIPNEIPKTISYDEAILRDKQMRDYFNPPGPVTNKIMH